MTPKERMFKALRGEKPDVLPAAPCYLSLFLANSARRHYVELYARHLDGRSRLQVDHAQDTQFRARALYESYGIFRARPDWIEVGPGPSKAWAERTHIVLQGDVLCYEDQVSGLRRPMYSVPLPHGDAPLGEAPASAHDLWDTSGELRGPQDVDDRLPLQGSEEWLARGDFDLPRQVVADYGDGYFISTILETPFSDAYDLLGFQGLMLIQHDRPELFHHLLKRKLEQTKPVMQAFAEVGIHGVYAEEMFTGADIISPGSYDQFVFAYNQPYFEHMSSLGLLPIHYACGDVIPRLERILEYDIAAVAIEESKKSFRIEIADVVELVAGRCAVFGNIDAVRFGTQATPGEMAAEVGRQARIGARASGFIVGTGSPFPVDADHRLIDTLVTVAHSIAP